MQKDGIKLTLKELSDSEYYQSLLDKLAEETKEVINSQNNDELIEELADLLTVVEAICKFRKVDYQQVTRIKKIKKQHKGDFNQKIKIEFVEFDQSIEKFEQYNEYYLASPEKYPKIT